ncbi:hypothetical protein PCH70_01820 [Pseudomonas cichorii JBC1]|nr:hypothetical protein PCH70_01820 [Pseudomonas cichorii JBC1]
MMARLYFRCTDGLHILGIQVLKHKAINPIISMIKTHVSVFGVQWRIIVWIYSYAS